MKLTTVFQISIYSLTALSGLMLAYAEESPFPSALTPFLCIIALCFNEWRRVVRLSLLWSNLLGLAALGLMIYEFFGERADARLLAGAHFLVYLIWVVLFQDKRAQQYWWLFALGLLQVAIGTVMTLSGWYGLMMLSYLLLALWTMAVFHLYQGALTFESKPRPKRRSASGTRLAPAVNGLAFRSETIVEDAVQQDAPDCWITSRFALGVTGISIAGLTLGMAMFLLVPRAWLGRGNVFAHEVSTISRTMTGISSEVRLGHLGRILESAEKVLEVRLYDVDSKRLSLEEFVARQGMAEPLFRGCVFDRYEEGRWSIRDAQPALTTMQTRAREAARLIRQEYILEPQTTNVLFALRPVHGGALKLRPDDDAPRPGGDRRRRNGGAPTGAIDINIITKVMSPHTEWDERLEYVIYSRPAAMRADARVSFGQIPLSQIPESQAVRPGMQRENLQLPPDRLASLKELAAAWTVPEKLTGNRLMSEARRRALTIESRMRDSGEFTYSLNMEIRNPELDPVEDFLINRKSGHCEYYASAMALMLRAVGVPARLVTGFKGAESVNGGEYYEVQQRHAHAWVEAYVDDTWIELDATPPAREESVRRFGPSSELWKSATDSLSALWSTYVISMSQNRQKEALYDPFTGTLTGGLNSVGAALDLLKSGLDWIKDEFTSPGQLLSGTGALLLLGLMTALALAALLWHWLVRRGRLGHWFGALFGWFGRMTLGWGPVPASRLIVEFYEKFLKLVGARGLRLQTHQTQREFALQVEQVLREPLRSAGLATLPRDVTDLYYRVRFGGAELAPAEVIELDKRIGRLADLLHTAGGRLRGT